MFAGSATEKGGNEEEDVEGTRRRTAVWMTVGDPRRRYPIRPSNDRLPCFCVSTAPVFPLARAGSTRGFSIPVLGPAVLPPLPSSHPPEYLPVSRGCHYRVPIKIKKERARQEREIDRSNVQTTITTKTRNKFAFHTARRARKVKKENDESLP